MEESPLLNLRKHGAAPFATALIHGGPGAPGTLAPVARELALPAGGGSGGELERGFGILEPFQTAATIDELTRELHGVLQTHGAPPFTLIGHSWGAWLSLIFAARHPALVRKLILVASAPFEESYAAGIMETRLARLGLLDRVEALTLLETLTFPDQPGRDGVLKRIGELCAKADTFAPLPAPPKQKGAKKEAPAGKDRDTPPVRADLFQSVWTEATALRQSGALLDFARGLRCPVLAIHGSHDPHPHTGVSAPLAACVADFRFILLEKCGHEPWNERHARERFFAILRAELQAE